MVEEYHHTLKIPPIINLMDYRLIQAIVFMFLIEMVGVLLVCIMDTKIHLLCCVSFLIIRSYVHLHNYYTVHVHVLKIQAYMWVDLQKSTMWVQILPIYIFANIFRSECSIPFL